METVIWQLLEAFLRIGYRGTQLECLYSILVLGFLQESSN